MFIAYSYEILAKKTFSMKISWGGVKANSKIIRALSVLVTFIYIASFYMIYPLIGNNLLIVSILPVLSVYAAFNIQVAITLQVLMIFHRFVAAYILGIDYGLFMLFGTVIGTGLNFVLLLMVHYLFITNY